MTNRGGSKVQIEGLPDIDDSWTIPRDHLTLKNEIGKGAFGTVYKADYLGIDVAVKTISQGGPHADPMEKIFAQREIAVLKSCRHPNVVAFIGVVEMNDDGMRDGMQIVLEYLSKGDLGHFLLENPEPISWIRKVKIALDVACGMAYIHSRDIIFRDLKSENLLLDDTGKTKICDFGFARKSMKRAHMTMCGTDEFMAPEIIVGNEYDSKADVFSYGMLLFEIITRKDVGQVIPRTPDNNYAIDENKLRQQLPKDCPAHFIELAFLCVKYDPTKRPDFIKIIAFLKKLLKRLIDLKSGGNPQE